VTTPAPLVHRPDAEFLVHIHVHLPPDLAAATRKRLLAAELRRGRELKAAGAIRFIWRIPGALQNVGVWCATDATQLHDLITSLPLYAYADVSVTALARHPIDSPI
jgi:muconolactone D-isomerase